MILSFLRTLFRQGAWFALWVSFDPYRSPDDHFYPGPFCVNQVDRDWPLKKPAKHPPKARDSLAIFRAVLANKWLCRYDLIPGTNVTPDQVCQWFNSLGPWTGRLGPAEYSAVFMEGQLFLRSTIIVQSAPMYPECVIEYLCWLQIRAHRGQGILWLFIEKRSALTADCVL